MEITQLLSEVRDAVTVKRVFGEAYEQAGTVVVPVARVSGGGGGGQGGRQGDSEDATGEGSGGGFGLKAEPAGVYVIRDGQVTWEPAVDVNRIVMGAQVLLLAVLLIIRGAVKRRKRRR